MIHSNSEGDIYIEEMPLLLVHLREEEKGADARLSEVLSYALDATPTRQRRKSVLLKIM